LADFRGLREEIELQFWQIQETDLLNRRNLRIIFFAEGSMSDDNLDETEVRAALTTAWLGQSYFYLDAIDSTNDHMKAWAADPAYPTGTVLLTDYQSAGRGRLDRRWEAPPGTSLLFSVLFRPGWPAEQGPWLTMLAGLAAAEAIEAVAGLPARLKWPNDVVIDHDGAWRKVGGLLLDTTLGSDGRLESAILGIGLNVNIPAEALSAAATPATSLLVAGGRPVARRPLLIALLERLERRYDAADAGRSPHAEWRERLVTIGHPVTVSAAGSDQVLTGIAEDTDEWGQLIVRDETGRRRTIAAGDVTLRGR
jgi:BirA family biotin operon repressor/biotin-[acetyl-CoA-carboxylase] ligase